MTSATAGSNFWQGKRVCVTGGGGFLGGFLLEALKARGADRVFVPRQRDYDLVRGEDVRRLLTEVQPEIVLHLAAHVGGIGANQAHPGEFFYDNLMMGVQLLHESWKGGGGKVVATGAGCGHPKVPPGPVRQGDFLNGY